jgi:DNA-binding XRE family transcriptional regulator
MRSAGLLADARRIRLAAGKTQWEVAVMVGCGVSQTAISDWESGLYEPGGKLAERYIEVLTELVTMATTSTGDLDILPPANGAPQRPRLFPGPKFHPWDYASHAQVLRRRKRRARLVGAGVST